MDKYKDISDGRLRHRIKTNKNKNPKMYLEDLEELSRREDVKYKKNNRMTLCILILTIIITILAIWGTFFAPIFTPSFIKPH